MFNENFTLDIVLLSILLSFVLTKKNFQWFKGIKMKMTFYM